jgi:hypothetical protein
MMYTIFRVLYQNNYGECDMIRAEARPWDCIKITTHT